MPSRDDILRTEREQYWEVIRTTVCTGCVDGDEDGDCRLREPEDCELRASFPVLVALIADAGTDDATLVRRAMSHLKTTVCEACAELSSRGECQVHFKKGCVVDRNYALIAEAVEKMGRLAGREPAEDDLQNLENEQ